MNIALFLSQVDTSGTQQLNYNPNASSGLGIIPIIVALALVVLVVAGMWKVFEKAGKPGWAAIVPIYNAIVWLEVAGRPIWWIVLCILPLVALIPAIVVPLDIAKRFGKGAGFGIGLIFLPMIFYPILGFGSATYQGAVPPAIPPRGY